jgi:hypothetical protein
MINIRHLLIPTVFITAISCSENKIPSKVWEEAGYNAGTEIKHGVTAFDKSRINYKQSGKTILEVTIDAPAIVGVAEKPESWGFFQFPQIYRTNDNLLVATWQMARDDATSYGKEEKGIAVSRDNGKTWSAPQGEFVTGGGFLLPNGDRIRIDTPKALKAGELNLPDSISSNTENYGRTFLYYKMNLLPEELQGVYLSRMAKGTDTWTPEHNLLKDRDAVRYTDSGLFPVVWWGDMVIAPDESVIAGIYPGFCLNDENKVDPSGILFYRSEDFGHSWNIHGRIPYVPDLRYDPNGDKRLALGFTEPASIMLKNGTYLCVMRTSDGLGDSPMYISKSIDIGLSWTKPIPFTRSGVLPRLLQLDNGVIVLASGRPGVQLRFCTDGKGEKWTDPFEMLPFENEKDAVSCGYTEIIPSGPDSFILIYSDFKHRIDNGENRKAIKVRHISVHLKVNAG